MMQIIMRYAVGDECTWCAEVVKPVEFESPEAALVEFERAATAAFGGRQPFVFAGFEFEPSEHFYNRNGSDYTVEPDFVFDSPDFLTVNEFFDQHGA